MLNGASSISPTKTLEYLAAGLPVVSTRVPDVVSDDRNVVHFADDPASFAAGCRHVLQHQLHEGPPPAPLRLQREWDTNVAEMSRSLDQFAVRPDQEASTSSWSRLRLSCSSCCPGSANRMPDTTSCRRAST